MSALEIGLYRHFKGGRYIVVGTATHTETNELLVVYAPEDDQNTLWLRPFDKFVERVHVEAGEVQRFTFISKIE